MCEPHGVYRWCMRLTWGSMGGIMLLFLKPVQSKPLNHLRAKRKKNNHRGHYNCRSGGKFELPNFRRKQNSFFLILIMHSLVPPDVLYAALLVAYPFRRIASA